MSDVRALRPPKVSCLARSRFDLCFGWPAVQDRANPRLVLERFKTFWEVVYPLLHEQRVYMYVSGGWPAFALLESGLLGLS